jgi:hypothetical protein
LCRSSYDAGGSHAFNPFKPVQNNVSCNFLQFIYRTVSLYRDTDDRHGIGIKLADDWRVSSFRQHYSYTINPVPGIIYLSIKVDAKIEFHKYHALAFT